MPGNSLIAIGNTRAVLQAFLPAKGCDSAKASIVTGKRQGLQVANFDVRQKVLTPKYDMKF